MMKLLKILEVKSKPGLEIDFGNAQQREMKYIGTNEEYLHNGNHYDVITLGKYTTFIPHGGQSIVFLFPTEHFRDSDFGDQPKWDKDEIKSNIDYIEGLIKQGQFKVKK